MVSSYHTLGRLQPEAGKEIEISLHTFFKNPASCILRSEMRTLVTVNDIWNFKG